MSTNNLLPESLGDVDATQDRLLTDETFVKTQCYENVLKDENYIILGRKGVGKTALARMIPRIEKPSNKWAAIFLANSPDVYFEDLAADFAGNNALRNVSQGELMYLMWEHFVIENCMKLCLAKLARVPYTDDAATIYEYLKSIGQGERTTISSIAGYFSGIVELVLPSLEVAGIQLKIGSGERLRKYFDEKHNYGSALKALSSLLRKRRSRILFLIDDIDENIDKNANPDLVLTFLRELLGVVRDINIGRGDRWNVDCAGLICVKAFVPTDLYSWLELRHADKFRAHKFELSWTEDELRSMFQKRLAEICRLGDTPYEVIMSRYFRDLYDAHGYRRDVFTFVIEHTFGRPRDIMNLYRQLRRVLVQGGNIGVGDAYKAIADYITDTVDTIIDEYRFVEPDLGSILRNFEKCDAVCTWDVLTFYVGKKEIVALDIKKVPRVLDTLYEIGLFGVLTALPMKGANIYSFRPEYCYARRRRSFKDLVGFLMHPVFRWEYSMNDNTKEFIDAHNLQPRTS